MSEATRAGYFWEAETSDGRQWREDDPLLEGPRSPWRMLEMVCAAEGLSVRWARQNTPATWIRLDSDGFDLVCGELLMAELSLTGAMNTQRRYRWVCRNELWRRVWAVAGLEGYWQYETPSDCETCPDPACYPPPEPPVG